MLNTLDKKLSSHQDIGILLLRLFIGSRLCYGVIDNIVSWEQMMEFSKFLEGNGFLLPTPNAILSVYAQFLCSICILIGYKIRLASLIMVFNFIVAILFFHIPIGDSFEGMTAPLAMLFGSLAFVFIGSGKYALEKHA